MGIRNSEASVNDEESRFTEVKRTNSLIAQHIHKLATRKSTLAAVTVSCIMIGYIGLTLFAYRSLVDASGIFEIKTLPNSSTILSTPILDTEHYFDDRVALVQSGATRNLTTLLTHTTVSYLKRDKSWRQLASESGIADLNTNLQHIRVHPLLSDKEMLRTLQIKFTKGVPLVIKPHFPKGTLQQDIEDAETRNTLDVLKWTLETEVSVIVLTGSRDESIRVRFNFDIVPENNSYLPEHLKLTRMSLWEQL